MGHPTGLERVLIPMRRRRRRLAGAMMLAFAIGVVAGAFAALGMGR